MSAHGEALLIDHCMSMQVVGIITRHDLTHENLHEKYEEKKTKDKEQRRITREREARTFATSMNINRTLVQHADVEADSEYGNFV